MPPVNGVEWFPEIPEMERMTNSEGSAASGSIDTELISTCLELARFTAGRSDVRASYEWRLNFSLWAVLLTIMLRGLVDAPIIAGVVLMVLYAWRGQNIWVRDSSDGAITWNYFNEAQRLIARQGIKSLPPLQNLQTGQGREPSGWRRWLGFLSDWSQLFQFAVTAFLLGTVYGTADHVTWLHIAFRSGPLVSL
jgi:hypothetical protein